MKLITIKRFVFLIMQFMHNELHNAFYFVHAFLILKHCCQEALQSFSKATKFTGKNF